MRSLAACTAGTTRSTKKSALTSNSVVAKAMAASSGKSSIHACGWREAKASVRSKAVPWVLKMASQSGSVLAS